MSIWSMWSAPLIMSNDLRLIAPVYRDILLNRRVIAIDQDQFGIMARLVANVRLRLNTFKCTINRHRVSVFM